MTVLSEFLKDFLVRIRSTHVRNSIAFPIVLILLAIALVILVTGYYVNKSVFYSVFEERESNNARNIHLTIESIVSTEVKRISSMAKILKNDTDIVYGLFHFTGTRGDKKPLKSAMDQLYPKMNLPVFVMADPGGKILHLAGKGKDLPDGRLREMPAFRRALKGEQVITASQGPGGWGIWAVVPVYGFGKGNPAGVILLGSRIDNAFASRIARETGSQVSIATAEGVIADSYDSALPKAFDPSLAKSSLAAQKPNFQLDRTNYRSYMYVPLKIVDDEFCLVIGTDISVIQELLAKNRIMMMKWGMVLLVGITLIGIVLTLTLIWPLNRLYGKALQVIREYSGTGVDAAPPRGNEISTLVRATDVMLETIKNHLSERTLAEMALRKSEDQLRQSQKMEAVGKLAGGVAHDFNNLLSVITGYTELLLFKLDGKNPVRRELEEIHRAGERAAALTGQLLAFSRRQVLQPKLLQLPEVVENIGKMLRRLIGEDIEFVIEAFPDPWTVRADPSQVEQILMNLVVNARDAMPRGGKLVISTGTIALASPFVERELTLPPGRYATLKVVDNGCGMDEAVVSRIFEPFYTTKATGKGTGLGLATVYGIVKQSDGYIRVQSAPGGGTSITVYLPEADSEECAAKEEPRSPVSGELTGKETILLVEDEEMVRELAVESLQGYGYAILQAPNGNEALSICESHMGKIDLLITDLVMPGMNGIELSRKFGDSHPGVPVLFMSGYAEDALEDLGHMAERQSFLQKPITPTRLSRKVREMLPVPPIPA
jgi:signal transduction histidine kinase